MGPEALPYLVAGAILCLMLALACVLALAAQLPTHLRLRRRLLGASDLPGAVGESEFGPLAALLAVPGRALDRLLDADGETALRLVQAGWRSPRARAAYFALQGGLPLLAVLGALLLGAGSGASGAALTMLVVVALILGILAPRWILRARAAARRARIHAEVPMLVHVLVLLFEAGLSTRQAIATLVREGRGVLPELGAEFEAMLRQLDAGADTGDVLGVTARQLEVPDLTSVLDVIRQAERYGGEVRQPLLEQLEVIEERRSLALREYVNLLSGRMTLVMVLFFFPALLIFVAGPAFTAILSALAEVTGR